MASSMSTPEGCILKAITDYLAVRRIWSVRMNSGAMFAQHNGKKRMLRFGRVGMADILATRLIHHDKKGAWCSFDELQMIWIEVKTATGKQSPAQKEFQADVEEAGHIYRVCLSIDDVGKLLHELG